MDANEDTRNNVPDDVIELGVASVETHGPVGIGETNGLAMPPGISEE